MKKSLLIALLGLGTAVASYGQGSVFFSNYYSTTATQGVSYSGGPYNGLFAGPEANAILLWGASTDTLISQLTPVPGSTIAFGMGATAVPDVLGTGAGWFNGGTLFPNGSTPGTFAFAFEATDGTHTGFSVIANVATSATSLSNPTAFPVSMYNFFIPVPEPTTMALGVLGGLSLLLLRRKQS